MIAIIFDFETTGLKDPRLVEAAWGEVSLSPLKLADSLFVRRYCPGAPIEFGAMATHHIVDEDVADCPPASTFRLPADAEYIISHNVDYDYGVACACGPQPNPKRICTLALSRSLWPEADSHSLLALLYKLDRPLARALANKAHAAAADVMACYSVLQSILWRLPEVQSWSDLWAASELARVPTHMPWGVHRGDQITALPKDYIHWALRLKNLDPYLRQALEAAK